MRTSAILIGSTLPIPGKAASQSSAGLFQESARTPVGHFAKSRSGLAKRKARNNTVKRAVYEASLPVCHLTTPRGARPVWEARFPEMGAEWSSRWQAFAQSEQAILAGARMAHQSASAGPDYPIGRNG